MAPAMPLIAAAVFAGAGAVSITMITMTILSQWRRISRLAAGHVEPALAPIALVSL